MAIIGLNLPTDIRWERVCVTEDMLDPHACDENVPPKWHTSAALFRYIPDTEYQVYPHRRILYYKLVCTLTSYQPQDQEIEGSIDWTNVHPEDIADFQDKLKTYLPCHGAIIQVTVAPPSSGEPLANYPYFLDFQPKQRALYEQATDSQERVSRSLEDLNVKKGAGTTDSVETLDIDQGFSASMQAQYAGTGGGFSVSRSGQWGTRRLSQEDRSNVRTTDSARESRDTLSHTTQITQMYNLFQAYHLGTNRAIFYVAPRPHVLEEPSGFIRGPRVIDGIQELFLVVSQPEGQEDPCVSVRLDTAHLTKEDVMDYDRSTAPAPVQISFDAPAPAQDSPGKVATAGEIFYDCYDLPVSQSDSYTAPSGFHVESVDDLVNEARNGTSSYAITPDNRTVTLTGQATGHACFRNTAGDDANFAALAAVGGPIGMIAAAAGADIIPKKKNEDSGHINRQLLLHIVSDQRTVKVGETWVLLVTSRGLCCCAEGPTDPRPPKLVWLEPFDRPLRAVPWDKVGRFGPPPTPPQVVAPPTKVPIPPRPGPGPDPVPDTLTARQANVITDIITAATKRISSSIADPHKQPGLDGQYMMFKLTAMAATTENRQSRMSEAAKPGGPVTQAGLDKLAKALGKPQGAVTRYDIVTAAAPLLEKTLGVSGPALTTLRVNLLGFPTFGGAGRPEGPSAPKPRGKH